MEVMDFSIPLRKGSQLHVWVEQNGVTEATLSH